MLDDLIEDLEVLRAKHGNLPVVMCTAGGTGEADIASVEYDPVLRRYEVRLREEQP